MSQKVQHSWQTLTHRSTPFSITTGLITKFPLKPLTLRLQRSQKKLSKQNNFVSKLGTTEREKVAKELKQSAEFKTIQSYITNSVGLKAKLFVYSKMYSKTETKVHSFQTKFQALIGLVLSFFASLTKPGQSTHKANLDFLSSTITWPFLHF